MSFCLGRVSSFSYTFSCLIIGFGSSGFVLGICNRLDGRLGTLVAELQFSDRVTVFSNTSSL